MNTSENNKIIAEFLSVENPYHKGHYICPNGIATEPKDMRFDTDWNWLMEVVEKIESLGASVEINNKLCIIEPTPIFNFEFHFSNLESTKFKAIYNACVDFINFYNQNK